MYVSRGLKQMVFQPPPLQLPLLWRKWPNNYPKRLLRFVFHFFLIICPVFVNFVRNNNVVINIFSESSQNSSEVLWKCCCYPQDPCSDSSPSIGHRNQGELWESEREESKSVRNWKIGTHKHVNKHYFQPRSTNQSETRSAAATPSSVNGTYSGAMVSLKPTNNTK